MIVYAPTIKRVEQTVEVLKGEKIRAIPYHGQMDADSRSSNQERWMSDEVRVLVGTIAFGLGINKAAVRAVIHLSLPKSIEQYYQEAGRAGRDGLPSDCLLLWQKRDAGLLAHFIEQIEDQAEKQRAWQRYHMIRDFCEAKVCRHRQICLYFGESPKWNDLRRLRHLRAGTGLADPRRRSRQCGSTGGHKEAQDRSGSSQRPGGARAWVRHIGRSQCGQPRVARVPTRVAKTYRERAEGSRVCHHARHFSR